MLDKVNCLYCKYFYLLTAVTSYSEYTPGSDIYIGCDKGVWSLDNYMDTEVDFRRKMLTANECKYYDPEVTHEVHS